MHSNACRVFLARQPDYGPSLDAAVARMLTETGFLPGAGSRVVVKPNLITGLGLACTDPRMVRAVCLHLLERGTRVVVADSPAFGSAEGVAERIGLTTVLRPLGVPVRTLGRPRRLRLSTGFCVGVSADVLEADAVVNVPRLKAHCQMRVTCAVKNTFGCVAGFRKALAHTRFGERGNLFESLILEVMAALPPGAVLVDAVTVMGRTGPKGGDAVELGLLAAGVNPVAVDTALYAVAGLGPESVPLWREALRRGLPGAEPASVAYPRLRPEEIDGSGFTTPVRLDEVAFRPGRLIRGRLRSLRERFCR